MHLLGIIQRDISWKVVGEFFSRALFLLFFFYVARKLGTADFGSLTLAISSTYILGVLLLDPGLNLAAVHMLVEERDRPTLVAGSILAFKLVMYIPFLVILGGISARLGARLPSFSLLFLASIYTLFTAVLEYLGFVTNAYHRMDLEAFFKILNRVLVVLFGIVAVSNGRVSAVLVAMAIATLMSSVWAWMLLRRSLITVIPRWHFASMKEALHIGLPIAGTAIVTTIYLKWDLLVLSYFNIGREQIGWYAGAFKIVEAFSAIPGILGAALFPVMVQLRRRDPQSFDRLLRISTKAVLLVSIPVAAIVSLLSPRIVAVVYGPSYLPGATVLSVLIWCIVPMFLYFYLSFVNIASGHAKYNLLAGCTALFAGLIANAVLVPRLGYIGVAWAALLANSSFALLATWKVCSNFKSANLPPMLLRFASAGAVMVAIFLLVPTSVAMQLGLGLSMYLATLVLFGSLSGSDLSLAIQFIQVRPGSN